MFKRNYSVFVGGMEVNDYYLNKEQAWEVASEWAGKGFDNVVIRKHASEFWEVLPIGIFLAVLLAGLMISLG